MDVEAPGTSESDEERDRESGDLDREDTGWSKGVVGEADGRVATEAEEESLMV